MIWVCSVAKMLNGNPKLRLGRPKSTHSPFATIKKRLAYKNWSKYFELARFFTPQKRSYRLARQACRGVGFQLTIIDLIPSWLTTCALFACTFPATRPHWSWRSLRVAWETLIHRTLNYSSGVGSVRIVVRLIPTPTWTSGSRGFLSLHGLCGIVTSPQYNFLPNNNLFCWHFRDSMHLAVIQA